MMRVIVVLFSLSLVFFNVEYIYAAKKLKPKWITETPKPTNSTYRFYVTYVDNGVSIDGARMLSKSELYRLVEKTESITVTEDLNTRSIQQTTQAGVRESTNEVYSMQIQSNGERVGLTYMKLDEYWIESYDGGARRLEFYTLYAVACPGVIPRFDNVYFTDKYGADALVRSLIPGWGQIYKGSTVKGISILAGEVVCVTAIIVCENQRASYYKKMKEQPRFAKTYNTKSDNWANCRNVCIGAAAALYVYNLIDAVATKGARKAIVKKKNTDLVFVPMIDSDNIGLSMVWTF